MKNPNIFSLGFIIMILITLSGCDSLETAEPEVQPEIQKIQNPVSQKIRVEKVQIKNTGTGIPENCVSWFDGCNSCSVSNGVIGGCTRKYCPAEQLKEPRCLRVK